MKSVKTGVATTALAIALLTGCGQAVETAVENATGADVEINQDEVTITGEGGSVTVDQESGTTTFTDEESGLTIESGTDVELPAGVPSGFPIPPAGTLVAAGEDASSGSITLSWSWDGITREDVDAYVEELTAAGYVPQADTIDQDFGDTGFIKGVNFVGDTHEVTMNAQSMDGMGGFTIIISPVS